MAALLDGPHVRTDPRRRRLRAIAGDRRPQAQARQHARHAAAAAADLPVVADLSRRAARRTRRRCAHGGHRTRRSPAAGRLGTLRLRRSGARHRRRHDAECRVQRALSKASPPGASATATTGSNGRASEFRAWSRRVAARFGYEVRHLPVGPDDPEVGSPSSSPSSAVQRSAAKRRSHECRLERSGGSANSLPALSLVVLIGATGSGKSTFASAHFAATEVLSSDDCRALVSDDENDQSAPPVTPSTCSTTSPANGSPADG